MRGGSGAGDRKRNGREGFSAAFQSSNNECLGQSFVIFIINSLKKKKNQPQKRVKELLVV